MWSLSAVADYKITGNEKSKARAMHAATILAGRFNHVAKYIRALNHASLRWAIIDCMMNLPLLSFATAMQDDPRFVQIAETHADTAAKYFIRSDGSSNHIVEFDPHTGEVLSTPRGQGYEIGSSWSRGQAWALYGFALAYLNLGKQEYLDTVMEYGFGFTPKAPEKIESKILWDSSDESELYAGVIKTYGGKAVCQRIEISFEAPYGNFSFPIQLVHPIYMEKKTPAIIHMLKTLYLLQKRCILNKEKKKQSKKTIASFLYAFIYTR